MDLKKIEVILTEDDYFALNNFLHFSMKKSFIEEILCIFFFFPLGMFLSLILDKFTAGWNKYIVFFAIFMPIAFIFRYGLSQLTGKKTRKELRKQQGDFFNKLEIIELRDDGVFNQHARGQSIFSYSSLAEIAEDKKHTYIFIGKDSALILPRDRIPAETLDAFLLELKNRI